MKTTHCQSPAEIQDHVPLQPHRGKCQDAFHHSELHEDVGGFSMSPTKLLSCVRQSLCNPRNLPIPLGNHRLK